MRLDWAAAASAELVEALDWYSQEAPTQVDRLMGEVVEAERLIFELPNAWHPVGQSLRSFRLNKFPYSLIYRTEPALQVLVFMHHSRRPGYWSDRDN